MISPVDIKNSTALVHRFLQREKSFFRRWQRRPLNLIVEIVSMINESAKTFPVRTINFSSYKEFVVVNYVSQDGRKVKMHSRVSWVKKEKV